MTTVTQMKCACPDCLCIVSLDGAIMVNGKPYCSQACATGHSDGQSGCRHTGCTCGGVKAS
ncbi:MAG: metallothionein [Oscillatoriales cyanobacterium SM2_2_1]|nr:metallothionein [Oscillatoriales cyanobacterium SM2_2_1]